MHIIWSRQNLSLELQVHFTVNPKFVFYRHIVRIIPNSHNTSGSREEENKLLKYFLQDKICHSP